MNHHNTGIVFIGPVCAGKSTQGKLVAEAMGKRSISLDPIAWEYYEKDGFSKTQLQNAMKEKGFLSAHQLWSPSVAYAAEQVVNDYPDCIIDFGAGHSHYTDKVLFERVQTALVRCQDVIFLLPSSNLDKSVSVLKERSVETRGHDWIRQGYDYITHWVKDDCNHQLATLTIYTEGKSPEETRDEILGAIHMRETR